MNENDPQQLASRGSQRTMAALIGALAVAAFLVGIIGVLLVRDGSDEGTAAGASSEVANETQTSVPDEGDSDGSKEGSTPTAGSAGEAPAATVASGGGGTVAQASASTTTPPTSEATVQATSRPQQGAATATATAAQPTATKTPAQQATSTPTRTPTTVPPTATSSATPTKAPPTATKSPTGIATATRTATPTPTATPPAEPIQTGQFNLSTEIDSTETLTNLETYPTFFYFDRVDYFVTGLNEDEDLPGGKARLVIQATCNPGTGSGLQHVRFRNSSASNTQLPCNRTVVDMIVTDDFIHGTVIVTTVGPAATVEWTLTATVLAIN